MKNTQEQGRDACYDMVSFTHRRHEQCGSLSEWRGFRTKEKAQTTALVHLVPLGAQPGLTPASILKINTSVTIHLQSLDTDFPCHPSFLHGDVVFTPPCNEYETPKQARDGTTSAAMAIFSLYGFYFLKKRLDLRLAG